MEDEEIYDGLTSDEWLEIFEVILECEDEQEDEE